MQRGAAGRGRRAASRGRAALRARKAARGGRDKGTSTQSPGAKHSPKHSSPKHGSPRHTEPRRRSSPGSPQSPQPGSPRPSSRSHRSPNPAELQLGAAAVPSLAALHRLDVRALQKRARSVGVDEAELAKVIEQVRSYGRNGNAGSLGYSPKHALIDLIQAKAAGQPEADAVAGADEGAAAAALPKSVLHKMGVRALRQQARSLGVDEAALTAVVEGDSPKEGLISLIEAKAPPVPEPEPEPEPAGPSGVHATSSDWRTARLIDEPTQEDLMDGFRALPVQLLAALQSVEDVDVDTEVWGGNSGPGSSRGVGFGKQLKQLKQKYVADLLAMLAQVEAALSAVESSAAYRAMTPCGAGDGTAEEDTPAAAKPVSLLESMAAELIQDRVLPALGPADLAALGQSCQTLLGLVRSEEVASLWTTAYLARWGNGSAALVRSQQSKALAYAHRANVEASWRGTRWACRAVAGGPEASPPSPGGGGGALERGAEGLCTQPSTVRTSAVLLQGPDHHISAVGFDSERGSAVTGDTDGLVRVWDVHSSLQGAKDQVQTRVHGRRPVGAESGLGRHARLAALRLHKKGHAVRWAAMHGRRLLCGCAPASSAEDGMPPLQGSTVNAGRLVLVDLDDLERLQNHQHLTKGVAAAALDARCGFIGTGPDGNGFPVHTAWAGVGGSLVCFNLELERSGPAPAPLPSVASVVITMHYEDTVDAAVPLMGVSGGSCQTAAVSTAAGVVCAVDAEYLAAEDADPVVRRWDSPVLGGNIEGALRLGSPALAAVPAAGALVAAWHPDEALLLLGPVENPEPPAGTLRVFDPRLDNGKAVASLGLGGPATGGFCPAISDLFSPPDSSIPTVLAMLYTGETRAIDLRMLGAADDWPVVVVATDSQYARGAAPRLAGGAAALLASQRDGALLGGFEKGERWADADDAEGEDGSGGSSARGSSMDSWLTPSGKQRKEKKEKKNRGRREVVDTQARRFPKKNNRRKQ